MKHTCRNAAEFQVKQKTQGQNLIFLFFFFPKPKQFNFGGISSHTIYATDMNDAEYRRDYFLFSAGKKPLSNHPELPSNQTQVLASELNVMR